MTERVQPPMRRVAGREGLVENRVEVWSAWLPDFAGCLENLAAVLSPEETARAARFIYPADRDRYILRHGLLRAILGGYTGLPLRLRQLSPYTFRFHLCGTKSDVGNVKEAVNCPHSAAPRRNGTLPTRLPVPG